MAVTQEVSTPRYELNIAPDYEHAVATLADLGWDNPEQAGVPHLEQVEARIAAHPTLASWLIERADHGAEDKLIISHAVGGNQGIGVSNTIHRFDPTAHTDGYVWSSLYGKADGTDNPYKGGDKGVIHDNNKGARGGFTDLERQWDVAVLLGDKTDPASGKTAYTEGLVYTNKTVEQQRAALKAEQQALKAHKIEIVSAGIGHIVADGAGLRLVTEQHQRQDQRPGVTRLIHYPNKGIDVFDSVSSVDRGDDRLYFVNSLVFNPWSSSGVRRLVRV